MADMVVVAAEKRSQMRLDWKNEADGKRKKRKRMKKKRQVS